MPRTATTTTTGPPLRRYVNRRQEEERRQFIFVCRGIAVFLFLVGFVLTNLHHLWKIDTSTLLLVVLDNDNNNENVDNGIVSVKKNVDPALPVVLSSIHVKKPPPPTYPIKTFDACCHLLRPNDTIYQYGDWDGAPIVMERYRLLFFTIPKVSCTVWKQLFRRMAGFADWTADDHPLPHAPTRNGLTYLYDYNPATAQHFLTSPNWTRAVFVRNPHERLLSAYLDKARHNLGYLQQHCCGVGDSVLEQLLQCQNTDNEDVHKANTETWEISFVDFLRHVVPQCPDKHWNSQADRIPEKYWVSIPSS